MSLERSSGEFTGIAIQQMSEVAAGIERGNRSYIDGRGSKVIFSDPVLMERLTEIVVQRNKVGTSSSPLGSPPPACRLRRNFGRFLSKIGGIRRLSRSISGLPARRSPNG